MRRGWLDGATRAATCTDCTVGVKASSKARQGSARQINAKRRMQGSKTRGRARQGSNRRRRTSASGKKWAGNNRQLLCLNVQNKRVGDRRMDAWSRSRSSPGPSPGVGSRRRRGAGMDWRRSRLVLVLVLVLVLIWASGR